MSLKVFNTRAYFLQNLSVYDAQKQKIIHPNECLPSFGLFWLALDKQGYSIAKEIFFKNNVTPDEKVYHSVCKLNLIEQTIPTYPEVDASSEFWGKILGELGRVSWDHRRTKSQKGRRRLFEQYVPMTSAEKEFYSWYKLLDDSLTPWREIINNIRSDWS